MLFNKIRSLLLQRHILKRQRNMILTWHKPSEYFLLFLMWLSRYFSLRQSFSNLQVREYTLRITHI